MSRGMAETSPLLYVKPCRHSRRDKDAALDFEPGRLLGHGNVRRTPHSPGPGRFQPGDTLHQFHRATGADLEVPGRSAFIHAWFVA
jgi:hypothetical protein